MKTFIKILKTLVCLPLVLIGGILISPLIALAKIIDLMISIVQDIWSD